MYFLLRERLSSPDRDIPAGEDSRSNHELFGEIGVQILLMDLQVLLQTIGLQVACKRFEPIIIEIMNRFGLQEFSYNTLAKDEFW
jgi:hypothetical protein